MGTVKLLVLLIAAIAFAGCETVILRQDIPVTTNPMGARIFTNGQPAGLTPATVSLERTKDHIITLVKEGYRQEDVTIQRQYQSQKVFMKALQSGINAGTFFKDANMGMNSGFSSIDRQEKTGEAYVLVPQIVKITLTPLTGAPPPEPGAAPMGPPEKVAPPPEMDLSAKDALQAGAAAAAGAAASQAKPIEKKWDTSSSSRTTVNPDGSTTTEKSGTSVGVTADPKGAAKLLEQLLGD
jgi:hypothetical protein